ncbi:MAG: hypothetical protein WB565_10065 [Acidimicrobiales bacterium]
MPEQTGVRTVVTRQELREAVAAVELLAERVPLRATGALTVVTTAIHRLKGAVEALELADPETEEFVTYREFCQEKLNAR